MRLADRRLILKKGKRYDKEMPRKLYKYFAQTADEGGIPSFTKFARLSGFTRAELEAMRCRREFERAYAECLQIRIDALADGALTRRFDPSFVKFLLGAEFSLGEEDNDNELKVLIEVSE